MLEKLFPALLIILFFSSCKKSDTLLRGAWIAVEVQHQQNGPVPDLNGFILEFSEDSFTIGYLCFDSTFIQSISFVDKHKFEIQFEPNSKSYLATIQNFNPDSLSIKIDNFVVKMIPIDLNNNSNLALQELIDNYWILVQDDDTFDVLFTKYSGYPDFPLLKKCVAFGNTEYFSLCRYKRIQFIPITFAQSKFNVFHIIKSNTDKIFLKQYYNSELNYPVLIKQRSISKKKLEQMKKLTIGNWNSTEIIDLWTGLEDLFKDSTESYLINRNYTREKMITKKGLLNNEISISFSKNDYIFFEGKDTIQQGQYLLEKTGNLIVLDSGLSPQDYLRIEQISDSNLVLIKKSNIEIDENDNYVEYYIKFKLKKQGSKHANVSDCC